MLISFVYWEQFWSNFPLLEVIWPNCLNSLKFKCLSGIGLVWVGLGCVGLGSVWVGLGLSMARLMLVGFGLDLIRFVKVESCLLNWVCQYLLPSLSNQLLNGNSAIASRSVHISCMESR